MCAGLSRAQATAYVASHTDNPTTCQESVARVCLGQICCYSAAMSKQLRQYQARADMTAVLRRKIAPAAIPPSPRRCNRDHAALLFAVAVALGSDGTPCAVVARHQLLTGSSIDCCESCSLGWLRTSSWITSSVKTCRWTQFEIVGTLDARGSGDLTLHSSDSIVDTLAAADSKVLTRPCGNAFRTPLPEPRRARKHVAPHLHPALVRCYRAYMRPSMFVSIKVKMLAVVALLGAVAYTVRPPSEHGAHDGAGAGWGFTKPAHAAAHSAWAQFVRRSRAMHGYGGGEPTWNK